MLSLSTPRLTLQNTNWLHPTARNLLGNNDGEIFLKDFTKTYNEITNQRLIRNSSSQNNSLISKSLKLR